MIDGQAKVQELSLNAFYNVIDVNFGGGTNPGPDPGQPDPDPDPNEPDPELPNLPTWDPNNNSNQKKRE